LISGVPRAPEGPPIYFGARDIYPGTVPTYLGLVPIYPETIPI
jgi:hypothetical protein